jgi:ABC-type cobalamin/Fe3+-siderophores transport system ATPase subunit
MKSKPSVIVLAGPNSAGKSTLAPVLLRDKLQVTEFVNAVVIARGLSAFDPNRVAIHAGRIMLQPKGQNPRRQRAGRTCLRGRAPHRRSLPEAFRNAVLEHKASGHPLVFSENGKTILVSAD